MEIVTLYASQCVLGESPLWCPGRNAFYWVDVPACLLYEYSVVAGSARQWDIGKPVSLVLEASGNDLILAVKGGVLQFSPDTGEQTWLASLDASILNNRCNDGAVDAEGRLWVGTMDMQCKENAGSLYRIGSNLRPTKVIGGLTIPNGLVWSLSNERMYFIDTPKQQVASYIFNKSTGDIYYEKVSVQIPPEMGMPDGMAIDAEGMLWIALWGGGGIARWNPLTGDLLELIKLPALNTTNCAFAGEKLDTMIVTSAREGLTVAQLEDYPESGNVFLIKNLPVAGVKIGSTNLGKGGVI